jgi:YD repeat-containing protein
VYSPDGTRYDMLDNGVDTFYVTKITDRNGNYATVSYGLVGTFKVVTGVSASDGRSLAFTYSSGPTGVLTSITANGLRSWTYSIANTATIGVSFRLNSVTPPTGSGWAYTYYGDRGTQAGSYALSQVKYPQGGTISYDYGYVTFLQGVLGAERSTVVTSKSTTDGSWSFSYSPATSGGGYDTTTVSLPGGIGTVTYKHFGYWSVGPGQAWKVGLLYQKTSGSQETETYTWDSQVISNEPFARQGYIYVDASVSRPLLASVTRSRDGGSFTTTYASRDVFGNPQSISESGTRSRTTSKSYANYSTSWILGLVESESVSGATGSISRVFDASGNVSSETRFGSTTSFSYFANGLMSSRTDPRGNSTSYGSYYRGIPQSEARPDGSSISRSVDTFGNVTQQSDGVSNWGYGYDALNRVTSISFPSGSNSAITWGFSGTSQSITRGSYSGSKSFDTYGRKVSETKGGITFTTSIDALGRVRFQSLPGSTSGTTYTLDILGRATYIQRPEGDTRMSYGAGSVVVTNPRGSVTTYRYDRYGDPDSGYLSATEPPEGTAVSLSKDTLGLLLSATQSSKTRSYSYTNRYLTSMIDIETGTTTFSRDGNGNAVSKTTGGVTVGYTYDGLNRVKTAAYGGTAGTTSYSYNGRGQLTSLSNPSAARTYGYDGNGNLTSDNLVVDGNTFLTTYSWDSLDGLASITYPQSRGSVTYSPNSLSRPTQARPFVTAASHYASGNPSSITFANGLSQSYNEDSAQRPNSVGGQVGFSYSYDGVGNVTQILSANDSLDSRTFTYDGADRLTNFSGPRGSGQFNYGGTGNLTGLVQPGRIIYHTYDTSERLIRTTGDMSRTYTYDTLGNITSDGTNNYTYDQSSMLTCSNCGVPTKEAKYWYDGKGWRVVEERGGNRTYLVYGLRGELLYEYSRFGKAWKKYAYINGKHVATEEGADAPATTTTLTATPTTVQVGQQVTLTANVSPIVAGTVTFRSGITELGTVTLVNGTASLNATNLSVGVASISASFSGSADYQPSVSAVTSVTVNKKTTTASIAVTPTSGSLGQTVTVSTSVTGISPTGQVDIRANGTTIATQSLTNGAASYTSVPLAAGTTSFSVNYLGDAQNTTAASSAVAVTINKALPAMTLQTSATTVRYGSLLTLTTRPTAVSGFPVTGTFSFKNGSAVLFTSFGSDYAQVGLNNLAVGNYSLTATYSGDANYLPNVTSAVPVSITALASKDLSGDGKSDLIFRNDANGQITAWLMNGTTASSTAGLLGPGSWTISHIADFNGDGKDDLLFRNDDGSVTVWLMDGTTVIGSVGLIGASPDWSVSHVGDFNGDGKTDILWRNTNGAVTVWLMDGVNVTSRVGLIGADPNWRVSHGDGKADILWRNTDGTVLMWLMNGATQTSNATILGANSGWTVTHTADFNGDGKADLLWRNTDGTINMWLMNGTTQAGGASLLGANSGWSVSHTGDLNGDGKADLIWRNINGAVNAWLMDGTTTTAAGPILGADANWRVSHLADYNGDGKADILWRNNADGQITMWLMNGLSSTSQVGILGASPWRIVPPYVDAN